MTQKLRVRPTRPVTIMALVAAVAMGLFGLFFLGLLMREGSGIGVVFMIFWFVVLGVIIAFYVYNLRSKTGAGVIEIDSETGGAEAEAGSDFESRIRKLERLRKDGLLTDEEYRAKKSEILSDKW